LNRLHHLLSRFTSPEGISVSSKSAMDLCDVLNGNREAGEKITGFLGITKHEHKEVWYTKP